MASLGRLSLGLNVVLLGIIAWQWREQASPPIGPSSVATPAARSTKVPGSARPIATPARQVAIGGGWQDWLEPLRRAGIPTDVLAELVGHDIDERWSTSQAEMQRKYLHGDIDSDALAAFGLQHEADRDRELALALGPEEFRRWDTNRLLKELPPAAASLPESQRNAVYDVERTLRAELRQAELDKLRGTIDQATLSQREKAAHDTESASLRALLGPDEAGQLQGVDDTEGNLRRDLKGLAVSDAQIQALAKVQRNWDATRSDLVTREVETGNPAYGDVAAELEDRFTTKFEQIAGAKALDEATARADQRYNDLQRFASDWKLTPADATHVYQSLANMETAVREYQRDADDRGVDEQVQLEAVRQLQHRTLANLTQTLGTDRVTTLQRNGILPKE